MPRKASVAEKANSSRAAVLAALLFLAGLAGLAFFRAGGGPDTPASQVADTAPTLARNELIILTKDGPRRFKIEIADTPDAQARGLMFRTKLADEAGMLFPHQEPAELSMWMRNTYIPLDMVFIREDGTVHRIAAMTEPLSEAIIASEGPVSGVLEIAGGAAQRLGLAPGDKVQSPFFKGAGKP